MHHHSEIFEDHLSQSLPQRPAPVEKSDLDLPFADYTERLLNPESHLTHQARDVVSQLCARHHGDDIVAELQKAIDTTSSVSTASHLAPGFHWSELHSSYLLTEAAKSRGLDAYLSLSFGIVPLNNITYPRGMVYRGIKVPFFPSSMRRRIVYGTDAITEQTRDRACISLTNVDLIHTLMPLIQDDVLDLDRLIVSAITKNTDNFLTSVAQQLSSSKIHQLRKNALSFAVEQWASRQADVAAKFHTNLLIHYPLLAEDGRSLRYYSDQLSLFNTRIYQNVTSLRAPVVLMVEDVVRELLIRELEGEHGLAPLLFRGIDNLEYVDILSASIGEGEPALFRFIDSEGRQHPLSRDGTNLITPQWQIELNARNLLESLKNRQLIPSMSLTFAVLLYHGFEPMGGTSQVAYLPRFHDTLVKFLVQQGDREALDRVMKLSPDRLVDGFIFATRQTQDGQKRPVDIYDYVDGEKASMAKISHSEAPLMSEALQLGNDWAQGAQALFNMRAARMFH